MKRFKVSMLPLAQNDMVQARKWYRQHGALLPQRFTEQVHLAIERIRETPFAYAVRYKEVHIAHINVFPYAVHFLVTENVIVIIAIHHTAISPDQWFDRT